MKRLRPWPAYRVYLQRIGNGEYGNTRMYVKRADERNVHPL